MIGSLRIVRGVISKKDFKSLCVKNIDVAGILYDVMSINSDAYPTFAEYARRSLLRLRMVKGLSEELISAIVIRGINEPHVKASATNEKLMPCDLVNFLSTFIKPAIVKNNNLTSYNSMMRSHISKSQTDKRVTSFIATKCFLCGQIGHKQAVCPKKLKASSSTALINKDVKPNEYKDNLHVL